MKIFAHSDRKCGNVEKSDLGAGCVAPGLV